MIWNERIPSYLGLVRPHLRDYFQFWEPEINDERIKELEAQASELGGTESSYLRRKSSKEVGGGSCVARGYPKLELLVSNNLPLVLDRNLFFQRKRGDVT